MIFLPLEIKLKTVSFYLLRTEIETYMLILDEIIFMMDEMDETLPPLTIYLWIQKYLIYKLPYTLWNSHVMAHLSGINIYTVILVLNTKLTLPHKI